MEHLQTNGYDCGVWVLATILAIVRGRYVTGMHERDMDNMRYYLHTMVFALPMMS